MSSKQEELQLEFFAKTRGIRELLNSGPGRELLLYLKDRYFTQAAYVSGSFDKTAHNLGMQDVVNHLVWLTTVQLKEGHSGGRTTEGT
jgi:hypothetical protein